MYIVLVKFIHLYTCIYVHCTEYCIIQGCVCVHVHLQVCVSALYCYGDHQLSDALIGLIENVRVLSLWWEQLV